MLCKSFYCFYDNKKIVLIYSDWVVQIPATLSCYNLLIWLKISGCLIESLQVFPSDSLNLQFKLHLEAYMAHSQLLSPLL